MIVQFFGLTLGHASQMSVGDDSVTYFDFVPSPERSAMLEGNLTIDFCVGIVEIRNSNNELLWRLQRENFLLYLLEG